LCSKNSTGSGSRTAAAKQPITSTAFDGATTFSPRDRHRPVLHRLRVLRTEAQPAAVAGTDDERESSPARRPCTGSWRSGWRPRSQQTAKKSENITSAIGRRPVIAAPIAAPRIACSEIGVSRTRVGPNRSSSPSVALKTPPASATSSPRNTTDGSRSISCAMARATAAR